MYVHLGRDYVLNDRDVIGIFNLETTTISPRGREFLNYAQKNGAVVSLSDELPQSYVLADAPVDMPTDTDNKKAIFFILTVCPDIAGIMRLQTLPASDC